MSSSRGTLTNRLPGRTLCLATVLALMIGIAAAMTVNPGPAAAAQSSSEWVARTFIDGGGREVVEVTVSGKPPKDKMNALEEPQPDVDNGVNTLSGVPAFDWSYGCSATSAAMLFGYYDRTGYANMYTGPANGGLCPLDNSIWGETLYDSVVCHECPLSAAHLGVDGQAARGHVDDYWIDYGNTGSDPYIVNAWTEHASAGCAGDFMGTNQSKFYNSDGSTIFYYYPNGDPLYDYTACEPMARDGAHGMRLFAESRGYAVLGNFSQMIQGQASDPANGFTFEDYRAEIDAGRPVLIHVVGHTMLGFGYDSADGLIYVRDTWDHGTHQMTWGGTYNGKQQKSVTVIRLADSGLPSVSTADASDVTGATSTLNGSLTSLGSASTVEVSFQYGTSPAAYSGETSPETHSTIGTCSTTIGGLIAGQTYYYRAKAVGNGTAYGDEKSFATTAAGPTAPSVTTGEASGVAEGSAIVSGDLVSMAAAASVTASFQWGTASGVYGNETGVQTMTSPGGFSQSLRGLTPGTTYYYRAMAVGDGTAYGEEKSFTTLPAAQPPTVVTESASKVKSTSAVLNASLSSLGSASTVSVYFEWGTSPGVYTSQTLVQARTTPGSFSVRLSGLTARTTYYYRAKAVGNGTALGSQLRFTTASVVKVKNEKDVTANDVSDGAMVSPEEPVAAASSAGPGAVASWTTPIPQADDSPADERSPLEWMVQWVRSSLAALLNVVAGLMRF